MLSGDKVVIAKYCLLCNLPSPEAFSDVLENIIKRLFIRVLKRVNRSLLGSLFYYTIGGGNAVLSRDPLFYRSQTSSIIEPCTPLTLTTYTKRIAECGLSVLLSVARPTTHYILLHIMEYLLIGVARNEKRSTPFITAYTTLLTLVVYLGYGDILWYYVSRIEGIERQAKWIRTKDIESANSIATLLSTYLYTIKAPVVTITTREGCYTSSTISLYLTTTHLLLQTARYKDAVAVYQFTSSNIDVRDPLDYLSATKRCLPTEYKNFIDHMVVTQTRAVVY